MKVLAYLDRRPAQKRFYARFEFDGMRPSTSLRVNMKGIPPCPEHPNGDPSYQQSEAQAQAVLNMLKQKLELAASPEERLQVFETFKFEQKSKKSDKATRSIIPLNKLAEAYLNAPAKKPRDPNSSYIKQQLARIEKFVGFAQRQDKSLRFAHQIPHSIAAKFVKAEELRGITPSTYNKTLIGLRSVFTHLKKQINFQKNPFEGIPCQKQKTIKREIFSGEQLDRLFNAAIEDEWIGPVIIFGMFTGLRQGDCCNLNWEEVNLKEGTISLENNKTDADVTIPIFDPLAKLLRQLGPKKQGRVLPTQAQEYKKNPDKISRAAVSFIRNNAFHPEDRPIVQKTRKRGIRKASLYDFASLRTTWATMAILKGVPESVVAGVLGHQDLEMIKTHYLNPQNGQSMDLLREKLNGHYSFGSRGPRKKWIPRILQGFRKSIRHLRPRIRG